MSDDLRELIDRAIARVPAGKAADAVLATIAETAVIVERGRWEQRIASAEREVSEAIKMATRAGIAFEQGMFISRKLSADADSKVTKAFATLRTLEPLP